LIALRILEAGPLATIQDLGRWGHRDRGVPLSGAMDPQGLRLANALVGNGGGAAAVEITWGGFKAELAADLHFAVTGAALDAALNGRHVPLWTTCRGSRGDILTLGFASTGLRSYLAISGGIDVPLVMGSRSTYTRGQFGGFLGRALVRGDLLEAGPAPDPPPSIRSVPDRLIPPHDCRPGLRCVPGPQEDLFTIQGMETFFQQPYAVTDRCDRMGIVLQGPRITHRDGPDIISDGTIPGAVQVPGSGQPMLLGADCQTTGGYAKIATVITADLPLVAQLTPGTQVRFTAVSLLEAREIYLKREYQLRRFCESGIHTA
jgi:biotin-dependent carboxylase-like uncharacterized protein